MSGPTPGPWTLRRGRPGVRGYVAWRVAGPAPTASSVCSVTLGTRPEDADANARLIASAPELLSALEAMRQHDSAGGPCDKPGFKCDCYARADAAIAKAKGAP